MRWKPEWPVPDTPHDLTKRERGQKFESCGSADLVAFADNSGEWYALSVIFEFYRGPGDGEVIRKLSPYTLEMIQGDFAAPVDEAVEVCGTSYDRGGRPGPRYADLEAVAQLKEWWPGNTAPGRRRDQYMGGYGFNPFVCWLGRHLRKLDPQRFKTDDAARQVARNALRLL